MKPKFVLINKRWHIRFPKEMPPAQNVNWFVTAHFVRALGHYYLGEDTKAFNFRDAWWHMLLAEAHLHQSKTA